MADSKNIITIIIIVAASALIVGMFIYFGQSGSSINSDLQTVPIANSSDTQNLSRELLSALSSLNSLKLDTAFFQDPAFVSLIDYSKDLVDEPVGRDNPFLPVQ